MRSGREGLIGGNVASSVLVLMVPGIFYLSGAKGDRLISILMRSNCIVRHVVAKKKPSEFSEGFFTVGPLKNETA